jgi:hypothetical protein
MLKINYMWGTQPKKVEHHCFKPGEIPGNSFLLEAESALGPTTLTIETTMEVQ